MAHITLNQYLQQVNHVIFNISMAANIICVDSNKCFAFFSAGCGGDREQRWIVLC